MVSAMYSSVNRSNGKYFVRLKSAGMAAVKGFTHGRVSFDPIATTVQFSHHPPLPFPDFAETVKKDAVLSFGLLAPDGTERPQKREVLVLGGKGGSYSLLEFPRTHPTTLRKTAGALAF
jgi:hypothetical protein